MWLRKDAYKTVFVKTENLEITIGNPFVIELPKRQKTVLKFMKSNYTPKILRDLEIVKFLNLGTPVFLLRGRQSDIIPKLQVAFN